MKLKFFPMLVATLAVLVLPGFGFAEDEGAPKDHPKISAEHRKAMADAHEKMAACLRSEREFKDCHKEMYEARKKACGGDCPFMNKGGKGHGKGKGRKGHPHGDEAPAEKE